METTELKDKLIDELTQYVELSKKYIAKLESEKKCSWELDAKGDFIYKDDIVDHKAFRDVVVFRNGMFCLSRNDTQPLFIHGFKNMKVIGNRFENPELMKEIEKDIAELNKFEFDALADHIKDYIDNNLKINTENIDKYIIDFKLNCMFYRVIRMNCHGEGYNLSNRYIDESARYYNQIHPNSTTAFCITKIINAIKQYGVRNGKRK